MNYINSLGASTILTTCLHIKRGTKVIPDYYFEEVGKKIWIVYPWTRIEVGNKIIKENGIEYGLRVLKELGYDKFELKHLYRMFDTNKNEN